MLSTTTRILLLKKHQLRISFQVAQKRHNSIYTALFGQKDEASDADGVSAPPPSEDVRSKLIKEVQQMVDTSKPVTFRQAEKLPEGISVEDFERVYQTYEKLGVTREQFLRRFTTHVRNNMHTLSTRQGVDISWAVFQMGVEAKQLQSSLVDHLLSRLPRDMTQADLDRLMLGFAHREPVKLAMMHSRAFISPRNKVENLDAEVDYLDE